MLAEKINSVAPDMPEWIRRWFLDDSYAAPSTEHQDWDLILADWDFAPLLVDYCEDEIRPLEKRFEAFMALMTLDDSGANDEKHKAICREIKRIILANREFAEAICIGWLGLIDSLIVKHILGGKIPEGIPGWTIERLEQRLAAFKQE